MGTLTLTKIGAVCAVLTTAFFVVGIAFMASSGVQVLIPDTGEVLDWIADVDDASDLFFAGAWLVIAGGLLGIVALVGFWEALKGVGPWLVLAPILGAVSLTLVTISHLIPISMGYGWVGLLAGAVGGWLGALSPASSVIDGLTFPGFVAFFVFMAAMGVSLLLRERRTGPESAPATAVP